MTPNSNPASRKEALLNKIDCPQCGQRVDDRAFILPPLAVYVQLGIGKYFWTNVVLTLLGFIPGILHDVYIMASRPPGLIKLTR